ncbi:hypothetical protein V496_05411 [Pseudogymnoascus sp. VKM F-4515 (FW-2607)]|nr:hypothetical protein V496_05411 [Pseudogymnoascus sp. VKM F-4515 (FW-2607)]
MCYTSTFQAGRSTPYSLTFSIQPAQALDSCSMGTFKQAVVAAMLYRHIVNQLDYVGGYGRPTPQRFLTPLGWAVRFPDGRIVYENRMGSQRPQPHPRGGFPSPRQYPGLILGQSPGQNITQSRGSPGHFLGQSLRQSSTQSSDFPGQVLPGQVLGQSPRQSLTHSSGFPGMVITQSSGQIPVFITPYPGQVLGQNPDGHPAQQSGEGWPAPLGPKPRQRFRAGPERVRVTDLKEDEMDCPICYRDYYTSDSQNESEDAVRIGCGHVYGRRCLDKWIQENDTCPTCRGKLDLVDDVAGNP